VISNEQKFRHCATFMSKRAILDEVRTLPLSPPKGGSKSEFVIFVNKNRFNSIKLYCKVTLCENFHQQSCSRNITLSNGVYICWL